MGGERVPARDPAAVDAERAILGAILFEPAVLSQARDVLRPDLAQHLCRLFGDEPPLEIVLPLASEAEQDAVAARQKAEARPRTPRGLA